MKFWLTGVFLGIFALSAYVYVCMAFPDDIDEEVVREFLHNDRKVALGRRGGGATVGYYYVVYDGEADPNNVAVVAKDMGRMPDVKWDDNGCAIVYVADKGSIVHCRESVHAEEASDGGIVIRLSQCASPDGHREAVSGSNGKPVTDIRNQGTHNGRNPIHCVNKKAGK